MLQHDRMLVWRFKRGSEDALRQIYQRHKNDMLALAISLTRNRAMAEDIVHDVFVSFARQAEKLQLRTSLKSYLSTCIANRVRTVIAKKAEQTISLDQSELTNIVEVESHNQIDTTEELKLLSDALLQLPDEQREIIALRLQAGTTFKAIAKSQGLSINTVQSRYRYGLEKLRSLLNGKVTK